MLLHLAPVVCLLVLIMEPTAASQRSCSQYPPMACCLRRAVFAKCPQRCVNYVQQRCPNRWQGTSAVRVPLASMRKAPRKMALQSAARQKPSAKTTEDAVELGSTMMCPAYPQFLCCYAHDVYEKCPNRCTAYVARECPMAWKNKGSVQRLMAENQLYDEETEDKRDMYDYQYPEHAVCGSKSGDWSPCVKKETANERFRSCCQRHLPAACLGACKYEVGGEKEPRENLNKVLNAGCPLTSIQGLLYCASDKHDNRPCCKHLNLDHPMLHMKDRCLRFCDPAGTGVGTLKKEDYKCLRMWQRIMVCHLAGLR